MMKSNDVDALCSRCYQPIFRDSNNRIADGNKLNHDSTPRLMHRKCPDRAAMWKPMKSAGVRA